MRRRSLDPIRGKRNRPSGSPSWPRAPRRRHSEACDVWMTCLTSVLKEWVKLFLAADGGLRSMAGNDDGVLRKRHQLLVDGPDDLAAIAARKVSPADTVAKQRVAGDYLVLQRDPEGQA